jgi:hypothetical protein
MGRPQWADVGMYLQTVMLMRAEGLHSCPQMAWSVYRKTVAETVLDDLMVFPRHMLDGSSSPTAPGLGTEWTTNSRPRTYAATAPATA